MDESESFYKTKSTNRQVRTYAYLHASANETQQPHLQIRESFKSANNLNTSQIYQSMKNRRLSNSPIQTGLDRDLSSLKSRSSHKLKTKIKESVDRDSSPYPSPNEADSEKETIKVCNDRLSRYETIVTLTEQENENLKQQNQYLLEKLRKMQQREDKIKRLYEKTKNYKLKWMEVRNEIEIVKEETYIYRSLLQDYKEIAMVDIPVLKQKVEETKEAVEENQHLPVQMTKSRKQKFQYDSPSQKRRNLIIENYGRIDELAEEQKTFEENSPMSKQQGQNWSKLLFSDKQN